MNVDIDFVSNYLDKNQKLFKLRGMVCFYVFRKLDIHYCFNKIGVKNGTDSIFLHIILQ